MNGKRLAGKVAIVTGAASGIGAATVDRFVTEGANVVGLDIHPCGGIPPGVLGLQGSTTDATKLDELVDVTMRTFGRIDILSINAAIVHTGSSIDESADEWREVLDVNVVGPFMLCQRVVPVMVGQNSGVILATSSIASVVVTGGAATASYKASKAAIVMLIRTLAVEYATQGLRANVIAPGFVGPTGLVPVSEGERGPWLRAPIRRLGRPAEVASVAAFLASDDASLITGSVVTVDGGYTAI